MHCVPQTCPPQTIFAGEFTSGNLEEVTEETPEIFSDDNQEVIEETEDELSVFSSESVPEFSSEVNIMSATADETEPIGIDMKDTTNPDYYDFSKGIWKITSAGSYRFNGTGNNDAPILIDNIAPGTVKVYLNNVNIHSDYRTPPLRITDTVHADVYIYLEGSNFLQSTDQHSAALQIDGTTKLIIDNSPDNSPGTNGSLTANSSQFGTGIGSNGNSDPPPAFHIIIKGGAVTASSFWYMGIGGDYSNITIDGGLVKVSSHQFYAIGGDYSNITINGGSVEASSQSGTGIESNSLTINGGSVTASSANKQKKAISSNQITINGGSVKASSVSSSPTNDHGEKVYCCTIENLNSKKVIIDQNLKPWEPNNHQAVNPTDTNLYAWLTGEDHIVNVGTERRSYIFDSEDSESGTFSNTKRNATSDIFEFKGPRNFIYNGSSQTPSITVNDTIKGVVNFTVKYFKENDSTTEITEPKDVGTYIVKIDVNEGDFYKADSDITSNNWKFNITPGTLAPTITNHKGEYDGKSYPIININKGTIPENSTIKYSVDNKQTWKPLNSDNDIPAVKTVTDSENTKIFIRIYNPNYTTWTSQEYKAIISRAAQTPNYPSPSDTKITVPWSCKKVGDITTILPKHWIWKDTDKSKELKVEEPISADAVYNGTDKGNYVTETVTYTITRKECEHKNTVGVYYSSPSCTSNGYSGDTYCNDCKRTIYYGSTIPAYGHDYDAGVITTEPTTETDGIITYTCKRCKHQDTKNLGKLGDGEPYIEGSFQKKGWDAVNDLIKTSKEKDTISIIMNGARTLPASVLSGIKGKDISLNLDMENGFIWKINGTSITAETPADTDLSVTNTAEYIPAALYSLISTNQNDFGFHLGRNGTFDFPAVLSVKADASCAGLMANLFWYDVENGVLQCIQTVTVGGAFERSIPYADFTLSKGQDYFIAFGTESLNGRVIHTDGSITDENGAYLRPADTKISSHSIDRNKLTVKLSKGCAGAQGYDFVISKKSNMLQTGKFSKTVSSTGKPQASFRYLAKGTWYVAARSWVLDAQGNKVYGSWTKVKKIKITVVTPQQPKIRDITVKGNTVTVTYTKCKNATGYEILLGTKYKTSAGEKYPVKKYVKRTEGKNTVTVTFTNVKKGIWYVTVRSWNKTSKNKSRVYSPYSDIKKFKVKK